MRAAELCAAAFRRVCRRHGVPAARKRDPAGVRRRVRDRGPGRGAGPARLARRADRQLRPRLQRQADRAGGPSGVHRTRPRVPRRRRLRAQAVRHPQAGASRDLGQGLARRRSVLHSVAVDADDRLQGDDPRREPVDVLSRSARRATGIGAGAGTPALFHQHLSVVEAGAPLPLPLPQRRDQHAARQHQLDDGAQGDDEVGAARRRPRQAVAADRRRRLGQRHLRQRARIAAGGRLQPAARDDDDDSRGVGRQPADGREAARLLRVPRGADGAVGRAGGGRLHRRPDDRRHPRPQRPAAGALRDHRRRSVRDVVGGGGAVDPGGEHRQEVAAAAGQDVPHRPGTGPDHRRRGAEGGVGGGAAVSAVAGRDTDPRREAAARGRADDARPADAARSSAGVRLHAGGSSASSCSRWA